MSPDTEHNMSQPSTPATYPVAHNPATSQPPDKDAGIGPVAGVAREGAATTGAADRDNGVALSRRRRVSRRTHDTDATSRGGRTVAWAGFVFGSVFSVVMNWLHTWLPADEKPAGWHPGVAPQIGSAVWPVCLLLAVEALSRVRWQTGFGWMLARYGGVGAVAAGSALISYGHVHDVLDKWGYGQLGAGVGPIVLDGLMVTCGFALLSETSHNHSATTEPAPLAPRRGNTSEPVTQPSISENAVPHVGDVSCNSRIAECDTKELPRHAPQQDATARDIDSETDRDARIMFLHHSGATTREIADEIGVHHSTVARVVKRNATSDTERDLHLIAATANEETTAS
ncbi:helix-turn-helix domain-containing protein [Nocardia cerradoensis]|uniref:Transposase IS30-like HTH domain-containing protein n=1 Tax=Nocardia cerradoensis TaxID=85688 RepID=A0A231GVK2_9NOCA|nr:helix-turn-helix domain-containing protein [Nocardia cerradoensis]NKY48372.1 helix-turn-helix domain-containing protein [Nocardia cerradoensis]OXR40660.1 hypothetical protein B7C42_07217 [Nocardia cerradoensis]